MAPTFANSYVEIEGTCTGAESEMSQRIKWENEGIRLALTLESSFREKAALKHKFMKLYRRLRNWFNR